MRQAEITYRDETFKEFAAERLEPRVKGAKDYNLLRAMVEELLMAWKNYENICGIAIAPAEDAVWGSDDLAGILYTVVQRAFLRALCWSHTIFMWAVVANASLS